jgi:hypothetical protein
MLSVFSACCANTGGADMAPTATDDAIINLIFLVNLDILVFIYMFLVLYFKFLIKKSG